jgi:hypothetical protein
MTAEAHRTISYAEDVRLHYDPEQPAARFATVSAEALAAGALASGLPDPLPWPENLAPTPQPLPNPPQETDSLSRFEGYLRRRCPLLPLIGFVLPLTIGKAKVLAIKSGLHMITMGWVQTSRMRFIEDDKLPTDVVRKEYSESRHALCCLDSGFESEFAPHLPESIGKPLYVLMVHDCPSSEAAD